MARTASSPPATSRRDRQRHETRERLYEAAVADIARAGLAATDIAAITSAAGVARGTFYFHFPTKQHVLVELEQREELRIVASLERRANRPGDLRAVLEAVVREVRAAERRLGRGLLRDMLSIHFAATTPDGGRLDGHPLATFLVECAREAQRAGSVRGEIDAGDVAVIFLSGLFALLVTADGAGRARDALLDTYVETILDGALEVQS